MVVRLAPVVRLIVIRLAAVAGGGHCADQFRVGPSRPGGHHTAAFHLVEGLGTSAWILAKIAVRFLALHTGLPALVVAAVLVVVGYRILKRTARFAVEVAAIAATLLLATELGWIRW